MKFLPKLVLVLTAAASCAAGAETLFQPGRPGASRSQREEALAAYRAAPRRPQLRAAVDGPRSVRDDSVKGQSRSPRKAARRSQGRQAKSATPWPQGRRQATRDDGARLDASSPAVEKKDRARRSANPRTREHRRNGAEAVSAMRAADASSRHRAMSASAWAIGRAVARPDQASRFAAVAQEDQRRPELDAVRAAERLAAAVFDLEVADAASVTGERARDQRLRGAAVAAPRTCRIRAASGRRARRSRRVSARREDVSMLRVHGIGAANDAPLDCRQMKTTVAADEPPNEPPGSMPTRRRRVPASTSGARRPDPYACWDGRALARRRRHRCGGRSCAEGASAIQRAAWRGLVAAVGRAVRDLPRPAPSSIAASTSRPAPT